MKTYSSLFLFLIFLCVDLIGQGWSRHFSFSDLEVPDLGQQILISGDTIYTIGCKFRGSEHIPVITMFDTAGNILKQRDIHWGWPVTGPKNFLKDGNRLLYVQSDDEELFDGKQQNGLQMLVLSEELDSLAFHYYPTEWLNNYLYAYGLVQTDEHYVVSSSVNMEAFEHLSTFLWINKKDYSLEKTYVFEDVDSRIENFVVHNDSIIFGYARTVPNSIGQYNKIGLLDKNGEMVWTWDTESAGYSHNWAFLEDGSTIVEVDNISGYPVWARVDIKGNEIWRNYRVSEDWRVEGRYNSVTTLDMEVTADDNILVWGNIQDDLNYDGMMDDSEVINYEAGHIMKVNSQDGSIIWERTLMDYNDEGAPIGNTIVDMVEGEDGFLYGTGVSFPNAHWKNGDNTDAFLFEFEGADTWLIKLTPDGCFDPEWCTELRSFTSHTEDIAAEEIVEVLIIPNPTFDLVTIKLPQDLRGNTVSLMGYDGALIESLEMRGSEIQIDMAAYTRGIYFVNILLNDGQSLVEKVIKVD